MDRELNNKVNQLKDICLMRIKSLEEKLNDELHKYATKHNANAQWHSDKNVKYYISYNNVGDRFAVDTTWLYYVPGVVYFNSKEVAIGALEEYSYLCRCLIELYCDYSRLLSVETMDEANQLSNKIFYGYDFKKINGIDKDVKERS